MTIFYCMLKQILTENNKIRQKADVLQRATCAPLSERTESDIIAAGSIGDTEYERYLSY